MATGEGGWETAEQQISALSAVLDTALDSVIWMDATGTITGWNRQAVTTFGWTAAEAIGRSLAQTIVPTRYRERHVQGLKHFLATGEGQILSRRIEIIALARDGREFPVELTVTPVRAGAGWRFTAFIRDCSAQKHAEDQLRDSETRYRLLFDANPEAMWVYDTATLRFLAVNDAAVHRYGYAREDFLAMTVRDLGTPADDALFETLVQEPVSARTVSGIHHVGKDGTSFVVDLMSDGIVFAGRPSRLVLARDVSDRRRLEDQLRQAQKMEAVGQLAGGIAHDFNNLLTAILGSAELLLDSLPENAPGREEAADCRTAALRAADLTRQLLAFSSRQVMAPQVLDLNRVVREMDKMLRRLLGEEVALSIVTEPELGSVRADPGQLAQVLMNLAVNARDAMPKGGTLTITTANHALDGTHAPANRIAGAGDYVRLSVSDTGIGMDQDTMVRAFEPFFTTKPVGKGTGLGLATVYGIVKQSGGSIGVTSEPGRGATFSIDLPRINATVAPVPAETVVKSVGGSETVLVVEDQEEVRAVTRKVLAAQGYHVLSAASGADALALVALHPRPIHLMATDVVMPGMSGRELSRRLAPTHPGMKVLFLSGYPDESIMQHGVLEPGVEFLQKPFTPRELARRVRAMLDAPGLQS